MNLTSPAFRRVSPASRDTGFLFSRSDQSNPFNLTFSVPIADTSARVIGSPLTLFPSANGASLPAFNPTSPAVHEFGSSSSLNVPETSPAAGFSTLIYYSLVKLHEYWRKRSGENSVPAAKVNKVIETVDKGSPSAGWEYIKSFWDSSAEAKDVIKQVAPTLAGPLSDLGFGGASGIRTALGEPFWDAGEPRRATFNLQATEMKRKPAKHNFVSGNLTVSAAQPFMGAHTLEQL